MYMHNNQEKKLEHRDEKLERWTEVKNKVEAITDKLGMKIDEKIKETIIGLSLLDIHTVASCEGHLDWGTYAPYIDIQAKEARIKEAEIEEARAKNNEEEKKSLIKEITRMNLEEQKKLMNILDEFYNNERSVPFYKRLIIRPEGWGECRLESQGVELQEIENEEIKRLRLVEYQNEMKAFTEFLKGKYLG